MGLYDGITSGAYTAKALAARFGKTKEKQTEFIEVGFEFKKTQDLIQHLPVLGRDTGLDLEMGIALEGLN
jgi:hypothetical protein